ncbi:MAG: DUF4089 domain-containing protein [Synechococcales cyanobacterium C42_A2020_086]|nr:DUF4089 domain-containing protein [Synechococcales cyanobacterium M58_A2018_015]MBF2073688.1 DUF4089 domain-containing protein [Synechococcales cyanobacterium C42_A2020_086]
MANSLDLTSGETLDIAQLVDLMAELLQLPIAPDYRPGVIANLQRTADIAQLVMEFPLPEEIEIAPVFDP